METPINAVADKIIAIEVKEEATPGGIILPSIAQAPQFVGKVISVGGDVTHAKIDDIIVSHRSAGMDAFFDKQAYKILKDEEVFGILNVNKKETKK